MIRAEWLFSESGLATLQGAGISTGWLKAWLMAAGAKEVHLSLFNGNGVHSSDACWQLAVGTEEELDRIAARLPGGVQCSVVKLGNPDRECRSYCFDDRRILLLPVGDIAGQRDRWLPLLAPKRVKPLHVYADELGTMMLEPGLSGDLGAREGLLISDSGQTLEERAIAALRAAGLIVRTVESCTAGAIAARLCRVPGSSTVVDRGWITYSNEAKTEEIGASPAVIARQGAVSRQVVCTMAEGGMEHDRICIAVSGIAGPGGGTEEKPVGTVWVAVALEDHATIARRLQLSGARHEIQAKMVVAALSLLIEVLEP